MTEKNDSHVKEPLQDDSVSSPSHDQSSKQEVSEEVIRKPEAPADKLSRRITQFSKDEFKVIDGEEGFIGAGGFGSVIKYHYQDKIVAIKKFAVEGDNEGIQKIWDTVICEANVLSRLHHENIVEILGVTQWPNVVGIVMEYIDGGNLKSLVSRPDLSWNTRLEVAKGIASGLEYIHNQREKKSFCHGDIKPENILVTKEFMVKLADFGSAAFYRATGASATTISNVSSPQFTLIYVAPEFLQDNTRKKNPAMDMYSFGMVLFEMISGEAPYSDCSMPHLLPALISAKSKPSEKLIDKAGNQLKSDDDRSTFNLLRNLMEKCCDRDPTLRPSSKTVKQNLSNGWTNQQQGSSSQFHKSQTDGVGGATNKRKVLPGQKYADRQAPKSFTPKAFIRQVWVEGDQPSPPSGKSTFLAGQKSVQNLLASYEQLLLNEQFGLAKSRKTDLQSLLVNDIKATAEEVKTFGENLQYERKYLHSIAIFDIASALFAEMKRPDDDLEGIQFCVQGMRSVSKALIDHNPKMKIIVRDHVIPLMRNWLHVVNSTSQVSEKWKCHSASWVRYNIEVCEMLTDQWKERMHTLQEAIDEMRRVFGDDVYKQQGRLYGNFLSHLASAYINMSRSSEAVELFKESLKAHEEAFDFFGHEEERQRSLDATRHNIKGCMRAAWEEQLQRE